jgi:RNA polymerase sigma-70 factor (ECF subfamily)
VDRELVELARQGDRVAFGELAVTLGDRLHALAHRILRDRELAGDVTQQTLVKIWQELPRLRDADLFAGWSYRILVNTCRDEMRKGRRSSADLDLLESDAWMPDASILIADRDQLERAFRRLTVDQRSVLILHYYLDFSLAEIGSIVDIPVGTVRSRLHYARQAMRSAIEADRRPVLTGGRSA